MDAEHIRNRITQLRLKKNISEHRMSLDLGHARSYIHGIVSGKTLPSMSEFLSICEYFNVTPEEFFRMGTDDPVLMTELINESRKLSDEDLALITTLVKKIHKGNSLFSKDE